MSGLARWSRTKARFRGAMPQSCNTPEVFRPAINPIRLTLPGKLAVSGMTRGRLLSVIEFPHRRNDEAALQRHQLIAVQARQHMQNLLALAQQVDFDAPAVFGGA